MKILLIGQAPGRDGDPSAPLLGGRVGRKLAALLGMSNVEYGRRFARINVLDSWPGRSGKGDRFPLREARVVAVAKLSTISGKRVLFVGFATASAFNFKHPPLRWEQFNGGKAAILPHPSGINRWYNNRKNVKKAVRFLRAMLDRSAHS